MTGATNRVTFEEAADLVGSARACMAFVVAGRPRVEPVVVRRGGPPFLVGVAAGSEPAPEVGEVTLVIDAGTHFFDLRAVYARGVPSPVDGSTDAGLRWIELAPTKLTCWDYGRLRATDEDH